MFWKKKVKVDSELNKTVCSLAEYLIQPNLKEEFRIKAKEFAKNISIKQLNELKVLLHYPPKEPELYVQENHGLGDWLSSCQFAIFELTYNIGEPALPFIREIAWGEYDWIQGNAIELLIRFASEGIEAEEIKKEIKEKFPNIRLEAQLYAIQPLIGEIESNQKLKTVFNELMRIENFKDSYEELTQ